MADGSATRIPILMSHGVERNPSDDPEWPQLSREHFERLMGVVADEGFESITYDDLAAWREGTRELPARPVMIDLDHPVASMREEVLEILSRHGFTPTLFVNTGLLDNPGADARFDGIDLMTWDQVGDLAAAGWLIGAHTVTHPNLSELVSTDPSGERLTAELDDCVESIRRYLGIDPRDFAFTGTSWSSAAEREVKRRFRFGRLWIISAMYQVDGRDQRYADLVGVPGPDEPDGGPPIAARYATRESDPYRLPSMDLQKLIWKSDDLRAYLRGAISASE
jgi:peptidoglycan/xylan/chitin deacetylase (PgdA/CDA1 family)